MTKKIIKNIILFLILLVALGLILAIVFYDFIPFNETLPAKVKKFEISEELDNEIKESELLQENIVGTYKIEAHDLKMYESTDNYKKGKANPFDKAPEPVVEGNEVGGQTGKGTTSEENAIIKKTKNK